MKLLEALKGKVKIKISVKPLVASVLDEAIEPALDKLVADSRSPLDNMLKAAIYPSLEKEIKERAEKAIDDLVAKIPEGLRDFIEVA